MSKIQPNGRAWMIRVGGWMLAAVTMLAMTTSAASWQRSIQNETKLKSNDHRQERIEKALDRIETNQYDMQRDVQRLIMSGGGNP